MNIPPLPIAANPTSAPSVQASPSNSPITSPEVIAKNLGLLETKTIAATVLASGLITGKMPAQTNSQNALTNSNAALPAANTPKNETSRQQNITSLWLKLAIAKAGTILLTLPASDAHPQSKAPPNGTRIPIKLSPDGRLELNLPTLNSGGASKGLTSSISSALLSSSASPHHAGASAKPFDTATTAQSRRNSLGLSQASPTSKALATLSNMLATKSGGSSPQAQVLNSIQQLQMAVSKTTPVIQKQLLPNKLTESLAPLLQGATKSSQTPEDLSAALKTALGVANSHPAIAQLQQAAGIAQQLSNKLSPATSLLTALLKGLPSSTASHESVQESRAAIAQWLNQELSGQLTRLARQQVANASHPAERNDTFQHQQEIPLKLGDEFTTLQLKIEEKREHEQKNEGNKHDANAEKKWSIFLTFEIPALPQQKQGSKSELSVEMTLDRQIVNIAFWCAEPRLLAEIQVKATQLEEEMAASGLTVDSLAVHAGVAPNKRSAVSQTRIDLKT